MDRLSKTILRSLLRLTRRPLTFPVVLNGLPLPLPQEYMSPNNRGALRASILYCFRVSPNTVANRDVGFYYIRSLNKFVEEAERSQTEMERKVRLSEVYGRSFEIGDVIVHKKTGARALVRGWDISGEGVQTLRLIFEREQEHGNELSPDWLSDLTSASSYTLVTDPLQQRLFETGSLFPRFDPISCRYVPSRDLQQKYPNDIKHIPLLSFENIVDQNGGSCSSMNGGELLKSQMEVSQKRFNRWFEQLMSDITGILQESIHRLPTSSFRAHLSSLCYAVTRFTIHNPKCSLLSLIRKHPMEKDDSSPPKNLNERRIRELEAILKSSLPSEDTDSAMTEAYENIHMVREIFYILLDILLKRYGSSDELITALNKIVPEEEDVTLHEVDMDKVEGRDDERWKNIHNSQYHISTKFSPGDIVWVSGYDNHYVVVCKERRVFSKNVKIELTKIIRRNIGEGGDRDPVWEVYHHAFNYGL